MTNHSSIELPQEIASPLVSDRKALLMGKVNVQSIARQYRKRYGVDIYAHLDSPTPQLAGLYRCTATGYDFFHPPSLAGQSTFYEELQKYPWYYVPWKWEHEIAKSFIKVNDRVLEVGCGKGFFLKRVSDDIGASCIGLEFNAKARAEGVFSNVLQDSIQSYAASNPEAVDMVCAFQVLEHVYDVEEFIKACCATLRPGGLLFISVPNNDSAIQYDKRNVLNMPPHHMGLWRAGSLASLVNCFPVELERVAIEPLSESATTWYTTLRHAKSIGYIPALVLAKLKYFGARRRFDMETTRLSATTPAHTIACVYRKKSSGHGDR